MHITHIHLYTHKHLKQKLTIITFLKLQFSKVIKIMLSVTLKMCYLSLK